MHEACKDLRSYLRYGHHECIVTTVNGGGEVNAAPMGVEFVNNLIILKPYIDTRTYSNILDVGEVVLNITSDSLLYYHALFKPGEIRYGSSKRVRPLRILGNVDMYVEAVVDSISKHDRKVATVSLRPILCYMGCGSRLAYSRANSLLIEALIHYTKLNPLINEGKFEEVANRYEAIREVYHVVLKVGNDELKKIITDVMLRSSDLIKSVAAGVSAM